MLKIPSLVLFLSFCLITICAGQTISGRVIDIKTNEPLPFVSVIEQGTVHGTYSDIDGYYRLTLSDTVSSIVFNLIGYSTISYGNYREVPEIISMEPQTNLLGEIQIRPGVNPAERIMRLAIANKGRNNPESDLAFTYDSYNILAFGGDIDSTLLGDSLRLRNLSKETREAYDFLDKHYIFLMESITQRKFCPPGHSEETIIANRVSGLKTTDLFLLGTQLQSFSFYGESVELLGVKYMSPLADNAINKYLFEWVDTTYLEKDTVFTVTFQPRSKKNFPAMSGTLYINSNGYALQNVFAEPTKKNGFLIRIRQQYTWLNQTKWFPVQLNSSILFDSTVSAGPIPLVGSGRSYIKNVRLNAPLRAKDFTPVTLQISPDAGNQADTLWSRYRERGLTEKETNTYHVIDSLGQEIKLDRRLKAFEALTNGVIDFGYVGFDLRHLLAYNGYEEFRLGGGLRTGHRISKHFSIGGYGAYGFGDQSWKYGGDAIVNLYPLRSIRLKFSYTNDVMEMGGNHIVPDRENFMTPHLYPIFISRMDRREVTEVSLHGRWIANISATFFANHQYVNAFNDYLFSQPLAEGVVLQDNAFSLTETGIRLRYAPGEKLVRTSSREMRLGGRFPVLHVNITKGWNNLYHGDIDYTRFDARLDKTFSIQNVGKLSIVAQAGLCNDDIPLSLLYNAQGTYDKFTIAIPNAFQTMRTNEFMHSRYALIHVRHSFLDLLYQRKKFKPQLVLAHSMLIGDFDFVSSHNFTFHYAERPYFESGMQIDNLISSGLSGFGVGVYYRYGTHALPNAQENWALKFTSNISF